MYKIIKIFNSTTIFDAKKQVSIPTDETNTEYQSYLAWLAEGNTPETIEPQ